MQFFQKPSTKNICIELHLLGVMRTNGYGPATAPSGWGEHRGCPAGDRTKQRGGWEGEHWHGCLFLLKSHEPHAWINTCNTSRICSISTHGKQKSCAHSTHKGIGHPYQHFPGSVYNLYDVQVINWVKQNVSKAVAHCWHAWKGNEWRITKTSSSLLPRSSCSSFTRKESDLNTSTN